MYAVCVTFEIVPEKFDAFLPQMKAQAKNSVSLEAECHVFDICVAGTTVFLYELYTDEAAFQTHLETPHYTSFNIAIEGMVADKSVAFYHRIDA